MCVVYTTTHVLIEAIQDDSFKIPENWVFEIK